MPVLTRFRVGSVERAPRACYPASFVGAGLAPALSLRLFRSGRPPGSRPCLLGLQWDPAWRAYREASDDR